ncbi:MAG TPA: tail fiber protein [Steroidobacteraceae bacterium]|jgi:microcystin-dependent protein|nr:tail fiber protein [Steroidobacteraceae bacterium]
MSQPFLGEIRMFGGNFAPDGWMMCAGQTLAISEYTALFSLMGTTYGGDGVSTFQLPSLSSRVPIHQGDASSGTEYVQGQVGGTETVTLTTAQLPAHRHPFVGSGSAAQTPNGNVLASPSGDPLYTSNTPDSTLGGGSTVAAGSSSPHNNLMSYLALTYIIAVQGIYPTRS